ncbi:MAG: DUF4347 domain-containing protein [Planctomycetota bacterium]
MSDLTDSAQQFLVQFSFLKWCREIGRRPARNERDKVVFEGAFEELEPRLNLSASLPVDFSTASPSTNGTTPHSLFRAAYKSAVDVDYSSLSEPDSTLFDRGLNETEAPRQLVIFDAGIENIEQLLSSFEINHSKPAFEVCYLDAGADGVEQICRLLADKNRVYDGMHVFSNGPQGNIQLGNGLLNNGNLHLHAGAIMSWASSFTAEAEIMIFGCDLPGSSEGQTFIESLALLTETHISTSNDLTGAAALNGKWDREVNFNDLQFRVFESSSHFGASR